MIRQSVRFFATAPAAAAKSAPLVPAPLKLHGPVGVYAQALWSAANEKGEKEKVARDAKVFIEAVKSKELASFIDNPFVAKKERIEQLTPMLNKLGFSQTSQGFVKALVAKNRLKGASAVYSKYLELVEAAEGKLEGVVTTAEIDVMTKKVLGSGAQRVQLARKVDKSVVSGLHVKFGIYELDLTGRTYINYSLNRLIDSLLEQSSALESELGRLGVGASS